MIRYMPFNQELLNTVIEIPQDLKILVEKGELVQRYKDPNYPENVFYDNDKSHTIRLVIMAGELDIDPILKIILIRMLWFHDLPEVYFYSDRDFTCVEKEDNPELGNQVRLSERKIAQGYQKF
jgi:hypothetical protein